MFKAIYQCDDCKGRLFDLLLENGEIEIKCGKCKKLVKIEVDELAHLIEDYRKNQTHTLK
ncbi:MAG: hypothetical protein Q4D16_23440 [Eubacteriales bacterium]|nr:hypothetical protein [Eubacteriales bacterium]